MEHDGDEDSFKFTFNNPQFSDRLLHIEVISEPPVDPDGTANRVRNQKRRRCNENWEAMPQVEQFKLFSNGLKESNPNSKASIRILDSEKASFMELLHHIYGKKLLSTTTESYDALLDLLMAADKFQVIWCTRDCIKYMQELEMTTETASRYLELPSCLLMNSEIEVLRGAAITYLENRYSDLSILKDEFLNLTVNVIEAILGRDKAPVFFRKMIYNLVLEWGQKRFPALEERREALGSCIARIVRFPYMTCEKLREFSRALIWTMISLFSL